MRPVLGNTDFSYLGACQAISLSADGIVLADVAEMWTHFDHFESRHQLGGVHAKDGTVFDTGVQLLNFTRMRQSSEQ